VSDDYLLNLDGFFLNLGLRGIIATAAHLVGL
jgi:hypothetical protein